MGYAMRMALLVIRASLGVDQRQPLLHPLAAVARHLPDGREFLELLGPLVAVAALGQPPAQPAQAVLLDGHQHGPPPDEDLIRGDLAGPGSGVLVEYLQRGGGPVGGPL